MFVTFLQVVLRRVYPLLAKVDHLCSANNRTKVFFFFTIKVFIKYPSDLADQATQTFLARVDSFGKFTNWKKKRKKEPNNFYVTIHISEPRSVSECDVNVCTFNAEHPLEPRFPNTVYGKVMWRQINIFKNILFMRHFMFFAQLFSFISKFLILSLVLTYLVLRSPFGRATVLQCT